MIGYVIALVVLAVFVLYLFVAIVWANDDLDIVKTDIDELYKGFNDYRARCDAHKKSIEYLSKSVRELNGVVEAAVKVKEETSDNKPDAKALISGWDADEPEPIQQHISKEEWSMQLVQAILNYQRVEPLPQQCILPLQQTPSEAMLPLWYINRRLEDI